VTANQDGIAFFNLVYPRDYAGWLDVDITVSGQAAGTENISTRTFGLAALGEDTNKEDLEPPANPFGRGRMDPVTQLPSQSFCTFE
jgi:hypothetical protein